MKWIIQEKANKNGSRSTQTWEKNDLPNGYVWTTESDVKNTFLPFMGFVNLTIEKNTAVKMIGNQELFDKWKKEHPEPEPEEPEATTDDVVNALIGYTEGE